MTKIAGDFMAEKPPTIAWLVHHFLVRGLVTVLWGTQGVGKTHLLIRLCALVSTIAILGSLKFLGLPVLWHGLVRYFALESPDMYRNALNELPETYPPEGTLVEEELKLRTPEDWDRFETMCQGMALVVIDPATSIDWGVPVSDNDAVNASMRRFDQIATKTGASIVLVLHRKKITQAESQFGKEDMEEGSALGAVAWLAKAAGRFQLLRATSTGLVLRSRPSKYPTFDGDIKLAANKETGGFHVVRTSRDPGLPGGLVVHTGSEESLQRGGAS
jgi:RecA-family ATPase